MPVPRNKEAVKLETEPQTGTEIEGDRWGGGGLVVSGSTGTNTSRALDLVRDTKPSSLKQGQQL